MRNMQAILMSLGLAATLGGVACSPSEDMAPPTIDPETLPKKGPDEAFMHEETLGDIFADGRQLPAAQSARMHACGKVRYSALGKVLGSRGVNINNNAADSAGLLYRTGSLALGAPIYESRAGESDRNTTGGIARLYDILIAAADEIIANMPSRPECMVGGVGARLFDDKGCNEDGFTCLIGMPVTATQLSLCNDMLADFGADVAAGRRLAVAAMAAANYLCD